MHAASAVAGLRGLGRAGIRVAALGPRRNSAGLWSRYASGRVLAPGTPEDDRSLVRTVAEVARSNGGPLLVYPGGEKALTALLGARELPSEAVFPYAAGAVASLSALRDKRRLPEVASESGLRAPRTLVEGSAGELAGTRIEAPCVIKAARPDTNMGSAKVVASAQALRSVVARLDPRTPLLLQERLRGRLVVLALVIGRRGEVHAQFQQTVERTWPIAAGAASLARSVRPDESLVQRAAGMLAGRGYWGLAQLDVLMTPEGPALVDVNPRFYTSLPLALGCGVNLAAAWHRVARGESTGRPGDYRLGVTYRWLEADVTAAFRGDPSVLVKPLPRPRVGPMWARDDPVPSALLALEAALVRVRRRLPGGAPR